MKSIVIDQKAIRIENRKRILHLLSREREQTILDMSRDLDISIPTITKNIHQFIVEGIVEEAGMSASTGGRRPVIIRFLPEAYYSIGVECLAEQIVRIVVTDLDSRIIASDTMTRVDFKDMDGLMHEINRHITTILRNRDISIRKILGIGFSLPGTVDEETRFLHVSPTLKITNIDFARYASLFHLPIFVENDANVSAMAEMALGVAKSMQNLVFLCILTHGIGGGIVLDGHLYRGRNKRAGEFSHMMISSDGRLCSCGRRDCWELYASMKALLRMYREAAGQSVPTIDDFFVRFESGEPAAAYVFDRYLEYLAAGIQNLILMQDPHYIVLGGMLSRLDEMFLAPLQEKVFIEHALFNRDQVKIVCSALKEDASVIGAALLPLERIYAEQELVIDGQ